jgi:isoprenylcysteine carboxyl methyltransferase (ICMT) family protein YpbQ
LQPGFRFNVGFGHVVRLQSLALSTDNEAASVALGARSFGRESDDTAARV